MKTDVRDTIYEREVRHRLTWRVILLSVSPLPLLLLLLYFLYYHVKINRESINELRQRNIEILNQLHSLEIRLNEQQKNKCRDYATQTTL